MIVASQMLRTRVLIGPNNDPSYFFSDMMYGVLERVGRSRYNGETSFGNYSLQVFKQSSKSLFYTIKKMRDLNVLIKQVSRDFLNIQVIISVLL